MVKFSQRILNIIYKIFIFFSAWYNFNNPYKYFLLCFAGKYVYIEASAPRRPGDQARLISESLSYATHNCLTFYYHMFGSTLGTLRIWAQLQGNSNPLPIWELSGSQGTTWMKGQAMIPKQQSSFKVCKAVRV